MLLTVTDLTIKFGGATAFAAVNNISFSLDKGCTLAIAGESGSGKSLTALALMGLLPAAACISGSIKLGSINVSVDVKENDTSFRGKEIAMVFQEPMSALNPVMSVGKQIAEAIRAHQSVSAAEAKAQTVGWLGKVQLPDPDKLYDRYPHQLSGGQKQRVMIAMAMCNHPALLVADEPTTALDATVQQEIVRLMLHLQQEQGMAMIFITHDLALAAQVADGVLVLYKGDAVEYGSAQQVFSQPKHSYTKALLASRPSPDKKGFRLPSVSDLLNDAGSYKPVPLPQKVMNADCILDVQHLDIGFAEKRDIIGRPATYFKAVNDVSFSIKKGEVLGLAGESGCGKSTLSRALVGLLPVSNGHIFFDGKDLAMLPLQEWRSVRRHIQMIFQDPYASLNPRMKIGDMLAEPLIVHKIIPGNDVNKEVLRLLALVELPGGSLDKYPHQFSGGQRQRIGIARALSLRPKLLICDESISALDVSVQAQILNLLKNLQEELGLTYLFISHDLSVVHYLCDRIMIMQSGRIIEQGDATQIIADPRNAYTRKLISTMPMLK